MFFYSSLLDLIQIIIVMSVAFYGFLLFRKTNNHSSMYERNRKFFQFTAQLYAIVIIFALIISMVLPVPRFVNILLTALLVNLGFWWLSLLFHLVIKINNHHVLRVFYYIGIVLTTYFGIILSSISFNAYMGSYDVPNQFFGTLITLGILILVGTALSMLFAMLLDLLSGNLKKSRNRKTNHKPRVKQNIRDHYYEQGLTDQEIDYFRDQMAPAKEQIEHINDIFGQTAKLRAVEVRNNTNKVLQSFFKDIVEDPQRLPQASTFLYKYLPSLEDLILKYNEINGHVAKNKQTYLILDRSAQIIDELCQQISEEYVLFHQDTYNELFDGIKYVEKNLKDSNKYPEEEREASDFVDELLHDDYASNEDLIDDFFNDYSNNSDNKEDK